MTTSKERASMANPFVKAVSRDQLWEKSELENVVHWMRQALGVACGIVWGIVPLQGLAGNAAFAVLNVILSLMYFQYLGIDSEEFDQWSLLSEGAMTSYSLFLVSWITVYSLLQG
ncbi:Rab5-interacting protein [Plasmodiophora brassicae]|uniref:Rab5-interacting protein n=1 Tax=Plasmodiophora brassicae TaxID=37360 RepID=A0A0G4J6A4_PLABS|nr:hypothetical protein PBRA_002886 [Plasmodiophora brassicae]SPQ95022.1 unnamed protein product [Plasmodiophora brassicae]